jgi:hypothetical protein
MLSQSARLTAAKRYLYTGETHTYHSLSELGSLAVQMQSVPPRRFLSGRFIFEYGRKRLREMMETPEHMALRLAKQ